jgi:hypothetical protein
MYGAMVGMITKRGNPDYSVKNLSNFHLVRHKSKIFPAHSMGDL